MRGDNAALEKQRLKKKKRRRIQTLARKVDCAGSATLIFYSFAERDGHGTETHRDSFNW